MREPRNHVPGERKGRDGEGGKQGHAHRSPRTRQAAHPYRLEASAPHCPAFSDRERPERSREASVRTFLLVRRDDARIIGAFTLSQIFLGSFRSAYLGYWIGAPYAVRAT